jgi:hypothetical protein
MTEENFIVISNQSDLDDLVKNFKDTEPFANQFKFPDRNLFIALLVTLEIDYEDFTKKYFYYDHHRKIHIAESDFDYIWISTYGLIAKEKATKNRAVNACINQYTVLELLIEKSLETIKDERIYDIDGSGFGYLSELSPALFHNLLFYTEVFCKAYLSLNETVAPHTHQLSLLYQKTVETMHAKNHNNSLFQVRILEPLYRFVDHVNSLPNDFREHFVKYDDNPGDDTVIIFEPEHLIGIKGIFELSHDFITDFYHLGERSHYLKSNLYQEFLLRSKTEEDKARIKKIYGYLVNSLST